MLIVIYVYFGFGLLAWQNKIFDAATTELRIGGMADIVLLKKRSAQI